MTGRGGGMVDKGSFTLTFRPEKKGILVKAHHI